MERKEMEQYILSQLSYLDENKQRAYSFNIKIYHLVLSEKEKDLASELVKDDDLNKQLWDELANIFEQFEKETQKKAYVLGKNKGHLLLKSGGDDGLVVYKAKDLEAMSDQQINDVYLLLKRFEKLYKDMFVIFRRRIAEMNV